MLIAVPETAWAKGARVFTEMVPKVIELKAFLEQRFPGAAIELVAPGPGRPVTKAAVLGAFEAARPAAGDLFVVMFSGHGLPADDEHPYPSWALTTEELTGTDLARYLHELPTDVDTVVISDCCYGRGSYHAGVGPLGGGAGGEPVKKPSMVCISTAGDGLSGDCIVLHAVSAELVDEVKAAAERGLSYRALEQRFCARRFTGREFHVDARPPERLDRIVLGM